jgi:pimeloyl-ACP methyl ester carboxylesterase
LLGTSPQYFDQHVAEINQRLEQTVEAGFSRSAIAKQLRCLARSDGTHDKEYRISAPTLVVAGDQDALIPACYARQMSNLIPGSEFVLLPECGHNIFVEKPDVIVPLVTEFLMRSRPRKSRKKQDNQQAMEASV